MTRVALVNPPEGTELNRILGLRAPPLGLMYLAAYLEKFGVPVELFDANLINCGIERLVEEVNRWGPDIVGLTATTPTIKN